MNFIVSNCLFSTNLRDAWIHRITVLWSPVLITCQYLWVPLRVLVISCVLILFTKFKERKKGKEIKIADMVEFPSDCACHTQSIQMKLIYAFTSGLDVKIFEIFSRKYLLMYKTLWMVNSVGLHMNRGSGQAIKKNEYIWSGKRKLNKKNHTWGKIVHYQLYIQI